MLMEGRHGTMVRVMAAYRPVKSMVTQGTVYNQQLRHWRDVKGIFKCPIVLVDKHLEEELKTWLLAGENVAVAMDANEDIRTGKVSVIMR